MNKYVIIIIFQLTSIVSIAQTKTVSDGAALLFKTTKSKLTNDEKNWLFKQLSFTLSKDKKKFMSGEYEVEVQPYITDMNKDGVEEVFIVMKSGAVFGNVGESFSLYTKNKTGKLESQDELGGGIAMILNSKNGGYPDIAIGGPGFSFPSFRWDGKRYKQYKIIKDSDLQSGKVKYIDLAEISKIYTDSFK
ncbi:MAG TPA: hypothetical protein VK498_15355 [Ferruginibacter sp.]|nr:hypothetical protein [Ferruginibacter sp.]